MNVKQELYAALEPLKGQKVDISLGGVYNKATTFFDNLLESRGLLKEYFVFAQRNFGDGTWVRLSLEGRALHDDLDHVYVSYNFGTIFVTCLPKEDGRTTYHDFSICLPDIDGISADHPDYFDKLLETVKAKEQADRAAKLAFKNFCYETFDRLVSEFDFDPLKLSDALTSMRYEYKQYKQDAKEKLKEEGKKK